MKLNPGQILSSGNNQEVADEEENIKTDKK